MTDGSEPPVTLVLLHGLLQTRKAMAGLARKLEEATGLPVVNIGYPSTRQPLRDLAAQIGADIRQQQQGREGAIFMVTHSLGGILWRILQGDPDCQIRWAGAVQIGPPNNGSGCARMFQQTFGAAFAAKLLGQAGAELSDEAAKNAAWPLPRCPVGIVAGDYPVNRYPFTWLTYSLGLMNGGGDGTVAVRETRLPPEVETDHVLVANTHRALIDDPRTLQLILSFMKHHKFPPDARRLPRREAT